MDILPIIPVLVAPTASGKKDLILSLLDEFPSLQIVFCDSRKIYRELEIGTAKPPKIIRGKNAWMVDLLRVDERWDAHTYARYAWKRIQFFRTSGLPVLVTAGTPLYLVALHRGLFPAPPPSPTLRAFLENLQKQRHGQRLHEMLTLVDPRRARNLHPNDHVRILRALEVFFQTGLPMSLLMERHPLRPRFRPLLIGIDRSYPDLRQRIENRVDAMVKDGLFEEVETLLKRYPPESPGFQTTGYRELLPYFQGKISKEEAIQRVKKRTWEYARQQRRFFRKWFSDIQWMPFKQARKELLEILRKAHV